MNTVTVIARVLHREGGINQVPGESWVTYFGQTPTWLLEHGLPVPKNQIEAAANYTQWMAKLRLDDICEIDLELGDGLVDFAVHSGAVPAIKALQRMLGIRADGVIGTETIMTCHAREDKAALAIRFECQRLRYVGGVIANKPEKAMYARNWTDRCAARIESVLDANR